MDWKESDPRSVVLVGGGGHAMVVAEAAIAAGRPLAGFIDDNAEADLAGLARRIGGMACLEHEAMVRDHPTI
ncbi:MAG: hypothetical protein VYC34_05910, partial [Planctomycetota bacterium]|nr:hypothetical protein [Planctomycetota bacterium]